jgi:hypothetical protein
LRLLSYGATLAALHAKTYISRNEGRPDDWMYAMLYAVSAKLIPDRAREFHTRLIDGSIAAQRPDGAEIVAAMQRARVAPDGAVRWTETCYCPTPLRHERATVLDRYFAGIETKAIDKPVIFDGAPLMDRLAPKDRAAGPTHS